MDADFCIAGSFTDSLFFAGDLGQCIPRAPFSWWALGVDVRGCSHTMHLAEGLEFRAVAVVACDDEILPLQSRIENVAEEADLEDTYSTERHLLYVACTRARDRLLVTGVEPASEFLDDLRMGE